MTTIDEIRKLLKDAVEGAIDDTAWSSGMDGDTTHAPSLNMIYDALKVGGTQSISHHETGTYTGDGTGNNADWDAGNKQAITVAGGVEPAFVYIYRSTSTNAQDGEKYSIINATPTDSAWRTLAGTQQTRNFRLRIISTGFEVADGGADADPNKNARVYKYFAIY